MPAPIERHFPPVRRPEDSEEVPQPQRWDSRKTWSDGDRWFIRLFFATLTVLFVLALLNWLVLS